MNQRRPRRRRSPAPNSSPLVQALGGARDHLRASRTRVPSPGHRPGRNHRSSLPGLRPVRGHLDRSVGSNRSVARSDIRSVAGQPARPLPLDLSPWLRTRDCRGCGHACPPLARKRPGDSAHIGEAPAAGASFLLRRTVSPSRVARRPAAVPPALRTPERGRTGSGPSAWWWPQSRAHSSRGCTR